MLKYLFYVIKYILQDSTDKIKIDVLKDDASTTEDLTDKITEELVLEHIDLFNNQIQDYVVSDETAENLPAVFVDFIKSSYKGGRKQTKLAEIDFKLHAATEMQPNNTYSWETAKIQLQFIDDICIALNKVNYSSLPKYHLLNSDLDNCFDNPVYRTDGEIDDYIENHNGDHLLDPNTLSFSLAELKEFSKLQKRFILGSVLNDVNIETTPFREGDSSLRDKRVNTLTFKCFVNALADSFGTTQDEWEPRSYEKGSIVSFKESVGVDGDGEEIYVTLMYRAIDEISIADTQDFYDQNWLVVNSGIITDQDYWLKNTGYILDDVVAYNYELYKAKTEKVPFTSSDEFNPENWDKLYNKWNDTTSYTIDEIVKCKNKYFKVIASATTIGDFIADEWIALGIDAGKNIFSLTDNK